jgi:hypothetical protein
MISLSDLIGKEIVALVPVLHKTNWQKMKLINVETSGIWIEYRPIIDSALKTRDITASPKTAVFFLPFSQIHFVLGSLDMPYISDEALK